MMTQRQAEKLTADEARAIFDYEPSSGVIRWRKAVGKARAGHVAGTVHHTGYVNVQYRGRKYQAHRLAWLIVHGRWPGAQIDHRNGDGTDNRLTNLRECSHAENHQNRALRSDNSSGCPGVYWAKHAKKWRASIKVAGRPRRLIGYFSSLGDASSAYLAAKREMHTFAPEVRAGGR